MNKMKIGFPESGAQDLNRENSSFGGEAVEAHSGSGNKRYSLDFLYSLRNNASSIIPLSPVSQLCQLMKWTSLSTNRRIFNEDQPQRSSNNNLFGNVPNASSGGVIFPNAPTTNPPVNPARHSISGASGIGRGGVRFGSEDFLSKTTAPSGDSVGKPINSSLLGMVPPPSSASSTTVGASAYRPGSTHLKFLSFPSGSKDSPPTLAESGPVVDPVPAGGGDAVSGSSAPPPPPLHLNPTSPVVAGRLPDYKMTAGPPVGDFGWPTGPPTRNPGTGGGPCLPTPNPSGAMRASAGRAGLGNLNLPCERARQHDQLFGCPEAFEMGGNYAHAQSNNGRIRQGASPSSWNDQDLWDSPMEGGAGGDIFTLGDIKQAERMIESQGISADMYLDLETRRVLKDQQMSNLRRRPPPSGNSPPAHHAAVPQDIFFGDDSPASPPYARQTAAFDGSVSPNPQTSSALRGESRFLSMFNRPGDLDTSPPMPTQISDHGSQLRNPNSTIPIDRAALDKALVREHLLRLIGANASSVALPASPPANRGTLTFSKPMNPAAPNFAPSGLFHAYDATPGSPSSRNIPPPPPADYRRSEPPPAHSNQVNWLRRENSAAPQRNCYPGTRESPQPHHGVGSAASDGPPPPTPTGAQEIYELIQRWVAKQRQTTAATQQQQGSQQPFADAATLALQALIQKQLANRTKPMTPEAIARYNGLLAQYLNRSKTTRSGMMPAPGRKVEPSITNLPPPNQQQTFAAPTGPVPQSNLINQQIAAIQAVLQQQLLGGGAGGGSASSSPSQAQQPANSRKQIAFLLQTWKKLKAAQAQAQAGQTSPPPSNRQISLSTALEQITAKHQANGNAPVRLHAKTQGQMSRPGPPVARLTPTGLPPGLGTGPPPGMGGGQSNQAAGPKSLEAARAQLSALLKDLVAQGGRSQALTALLKKTTPGHAQAIQQQIQALLQQRANGSNKEGPDPTQTLPDAQTSFEMPPRISSTEQSNSSTDKENFGGGGVSVSRDRDVVSVQDKVSMPEDTPAFCEGPTAGPRGSLPKSLNEEPLG